MPKQFLKSTVMNLAWTIYKRSNKEFKDCLRIAWRNIHLVHKMKSQVVHFFYVKADKTIREAFGTLQDQYIPQITYPKRNANMLIQRYFDVTEQQWRSFRKENLL